MLFSTNRSCTQFSLARLSRIRFAPATFFRIAVLTISLATMITFNPVQAADANPQVRLTVSQGGQTLGNIDLELLPEDSPETVANFLRLVDSGFYTGLVFHRVIPGFMIQAGGFDEKLSRRDAPRTVQNESTNGVRNLKGTVAMARTNDPNSAGSQFYINVTHNPSLDAQRMRPGYTVFGRVSAGMDVVTRIENQPTQFEKGMQDVPVQDVVIKRAVRL